MFPLLSLSTVCAVESDFRLLREDKHVRCDWLALHHVVKLGMLKDLGAKIPQLLAILCQGGQARCGTVGNSLIAVNERVLFLGRLCKASKYPPGYACRTVLCLVERCPCVSCGS